MKLKYILIILTLFSAISTQSAPPDIMIDPVNGFDFFAPSGSPQLTGTVTFYLNRPRPWQVTSFKIKNDQMNVFSVTTPMPINLQPMMLETLSVVFDPSVAPAGQEIAELWLYFTQLDNNRQDSARLYLIARVTDKNLQKISADISIPNISVSVGQSFSLPVILKKFQTQDQVPLDCNFTLSFNASVIAPLDSVQSTIQYGINHINVSLNLGRVPAEGDTLTTIKMIAGLGDAEKTDVEIENFKWIYQNFPIVSDLNLFDGSVTINDIANFNGIPRLIVQVDTTLKINVAENSVTGDYSITVRYTDAAHLQIYDVMGNLLSDYSALLPLLTTIGEKDISIPRASFPVAGTYVIKLSNYNKFISKLIIVQ